MIPIHISDVIRSDEKSDLILILEVDYIEYNYIILVISAVLSTGPRF